MSSEQLADGVNPLDAELAATWDILKGYSGRDTDLGIARRFGAASAAYSLRDIGAMNGRVVKVRRDSGETTDPEEDFSANQVQDGTLEKWVNGELETTLPADVATAAAAYSLRKVKADYSGNAVRIRRSSDDVEVDVAFDSDDKVSASSAITNVSEEGGESGSTTATDLNGFLNEVLDNKFSPVTYPDNIAAIYRQWTTLTATTTSLVATTGTVDTNAARYCYALPSAITPSDASGLKLRLSGTVSYTASSGGGLIVKLSQDANGGNSYDFVNPTLTGVGTIISDTLKFVNGNSGDFVLEFNGSASHNLRSIDFLQTEVTSGTTSVSFTNLKFEIIEHGATVHTWYDQAGSNNAVQETAANQPKIADNGALLDGIKFNAATDGTSPNFLQVATKLGVTTDHFVSAVFNGYQTDSSAFGAFLNTRNGNAGFQYGIASTDKVQAFFYAGAGNNANSSSSFTLSNNSAKRLVTFDKDGNNLTGFGNATTNGISLSNGINTPSTTVTNIGVGGNVGTTTSLGLRANINELIVYETDEADNRFKIESNINNYYGLYNDANDLTQSTWQNTGTESFSSTSTDGFSYSNSSSTAFIGVTLSETLALNDSVFISFNASGVTHPASSDQSPQVRLRDSVSGGSGTSSINQVVNGFNSYELEYTTGSSGQHIVFSEGDTAGGTVTISDFKVSRIARNGFVETWYDQSANQRDAIQGTATNQPSIVQNGGIVKVNSKPAITFDGNDNFLEVDGSGSAVAYSFSPSGDMGMFIVSKQFTGNVVDGRDGSGDGIFLQQASSNTTRFRYNGDGSIDITATRDAQHFSTMTLDGTTLSASVDGGTAGTDTVTAGVSTTNNLVLGKAFSGNNSNFTDGEIQEAIFYENNKTADKSNIETDIDNFYSIT